MTTAHSFNKAEVGLTATMHELETLVQKLKAARRPEDVFGELTDDDQFTEARKIYRRLAQQIHPDARPGTADDALANEGFMLLNQWWERAQIKIVNGHYGSPNDPIVIQTRHRQYLVTDFLASGDMCNLYHCTYTLDGANRNGIFKMTRSVSDNDLVGNEARILDHLLKQADPDTHAYYPELVESIMYKDMDGSPPLRVNILGVVNEIGSPKELYTLKEICEHYPNGIDARDMAWMWRRLLIALGTAHQQKVIHGAVLPTHVLIHPEMHGLVLIDWSYAVLDPPNTGERISAVSAAYADWYPQEVYAKHEPLPGLDIFMGARCMVVLIGGDPLKGTFPASVPPRLQKFFNWCLMPGERMRPQDTWKVLEEFDTTIEAIWGPRRYRRFEMPPKK